MRENYKIPNRIKNLMTVDFLKLLKTKLDEIFKITTNTTAWSAYYHLEGTFGWTDAFKYACANHPISHFGVGLLRYCKTLDWYDGDIFDYEITKLMVKHGIIQEGSGKESDDKDGASNEY